MITLVLVDLYSLPTPEYTVVLYLDSFYRGFHIIVHTATLGLII